MFKWLSNLSPEPLSIAYTAAWAWQEACDMYDQLHQQAQRSHVRALLTRHARTSESLLALDEQRAIAQSHLPEIRAIPLAQIRGTEGRQTDFDAQFRPLHPQIRERW